MKKYLAVAMAALIGSAPLSATVQARDGTAVERKVDQAGQKQRWKKGGKYKGQGSTVTNYQRHKLKAPQNGQRWVRDGNDFLLVAIGTGIIVSIVKGAGN